MQRTRGGTGVWFIAVAAAVGLSLFFVDFSSEPPGPVEPGLPADIRPGAAAELDALLIAMRTMDPMEADRAIATLASREESVVPTLVGALGSVNASGQQLRDAKAAIVAIGPTALPEVLAFFVQSEGEMAKRAAQTVRDLIPSASQWQAAQDNPFARRWTAAHAAQLRQYEAPIIKRLAHRDDLIRRYAVLILASLPPGGRTEASIPALMQAFESEDEALRNEASSALTVSGAAARDAVPRLIHNLDHKEEIMRDMSLAILTRLGEDLPEVATELVRRLDNERDPLERTGLACALALMGENARPALPWFEQELLSGESDRAGTALNCLAHMGGLADPMLQGVLRGSDATARGLAAEGLGRLGAAVSPEAIEALQKAAKSDDAALARKADVALNQIRRAQKDALADR